MFDVKSNGSIGFEVIDPNGQTLCWTVLESLAHRIADFLNGSLSDSSQVIVVLLEKFMRFYRKVFGCLLLENLQIPMNSKRFLGI